MEFIDTKRQQKIADKWSITYPSHRQNNYLFCYRVSPIIRPTRKIRPSVIFEDDFNVSPTLKISPS